MCADLGESLNALNVHRWVWAPHALDQHHRYDTIALLIIIIIHICGIIWLVITMYMTIHAQT